VIIRTVDPVDATDAVAEFYQDDVRDAGTVFSHTRAMAVNPEAYAAFENLVRTIVPSIGARTYELATLGAARALRSTHCLLAHGRKTVNAGFLDDQQLVSFAAGRLERLSEADAAVVRYAEKLSTDAATMTDADSQALRDVGFTDRQIVDITLAASVRNYLSRALQALAVPVDAVPGLSATLTGALTAAGAAPRTAQP
jgi:alkylhydroperoxidase family enzyme